jgi:hypothetical protein
MLCDITKKAREENVRSANDQSAVQINNETEVAKIL